MVEESSQVHNGWDKGLIEMYSMTCKEDDNEDSVVAFDCWENADGSTKLQEEINQESKTFEEVNEKQMLKKEKKRETKLKSKQKMKAMIAT